MYKDQIRSYTVIAFFISFIISLALGYALLATRTRDIVSGATSIELAGSCKLILFDTRLQPITTLVLACPRTDLIRLWPLPMQQPWFEDWWEEPAPVLDWRKLGFWVIQVNPGVTPNKQSHEHKSWFD